MRSHSLTYQSSSIHYYCYGTGSNLLFCFHGYGEDATSFSVLEPYLREDFKVIAIDLPFHGKTQWREGLFTPTQLRDILLLIAGDTKQFFLTGFSLGGRIVLQLLQLIPAKIKCVVLLAPDGLHKNFWYKFSTQTKFGNNIFKYSMKHPTILFRSMEWSKKMRLLNTTFYKVGHYYLDEEISRVLLYKRWTCLRTFTPDLPEIKKIIASHKMSVHLVFGKYDKVILSETGKKFIYGIESFAFVHKISAGHQLLKEKHASVIARFFYK